MEKFFEINKNKHNIRCKLYFNKGERIEKAVLFCHGFAGHKNNKSAEKFADRVLSKYKGIAVIMFNMPCHDDDVKKKLMLQDCMEYISLTVDYIKTELHASEIYCYAVSMGGYLVLKYIHDNDNPFKKIVLRSPAVNIAESLKQNVIKHDELDALQRGKSVKIGFDRKVEINNQFLTDLEEADIRKYDYIDFADDMLILHGTRDEIVSFDEVRRFAENNIIDFIPFEDGDHRFQNPELMELATKKIIEFFGLGR
jgi:uncharacterized protein